MFILVLPHNENKLHPIHRTIKSQDNFGYKLRAYIYFTTFAFIIIYL